MHKNCTKVKNAKRDKILEKYNILKMLRGIKY